jgi:hypothetical protein
MSAAYGFVGAVSLRRSSGAMNCGVPFTVNGTKLSSIYFEMPKSAILIHQGSGGCDIIRMS